MILTNNRLVKYLIEAREELRKVTWPSQKDVIRYTVAVIVVSLLLAAYLGGLDFALTKGLEWLIQLGK